MISLARGRCSVKVKRYKYEGVKKRDSTSNKVGKRRFVRLSSLFCPRLADERCRSQGFECQSQKPKVRWIL